VAPVPARGPAPLPYSGSCLVTGTGCGTAILRRPSRKISLRALSTKPSGTASSIRGWGRKARYPGWRSADTPEPDGRSSDRRAQPHQLPGSPGGLSPFLNSTTGQVSRSCPD